MGKIVIEKKRKKKKGRPSLIDLHKRTLKQHKHLLNLHNKNLTNNNNSSKNIKNTTTTIKLQPTNSNCSPNSSSAAVTRRSTRRNPNPDSNCDGDRVSGKKRKNKINKRRRRRKKKVEDDDDEDEDEDEEEDQLDDDEKLGFDQIEVKYTRKRKIDLISGGSIGDDAFEEKLQVEKESIPVIKEAKIEQGSNKEDDGPSTPLPDKKLLLFILDRLQKKDSYGVFADPVDPEELPDYHEIIEHPMDFTTVRKKLDDGSYGFMEQFEKDIFLICSNAMQYNAPDTIYFRQACSIQELAKKNFENLRHNSDDDEQEREPKVVRRGRPPKNMKRPLGRPPLVRANSDFSEATLATAGGPTNRLNSDLKKGSPQKEKYGSTDSFARTLLGSRNSEPYMGRSAERFDRSDDMIGSSSKGISMKHGKRQIVLDESRRNTYKQSHTLACTHEPSVLTTFRGERKQLIAVGLHTQYGYARSLAQFAAKLGPVAWKVASRKIERCLPSSVRFGQGWVGEDAVPSKKPLQNSPETSCQSSPPVTVPASADSRSTSTHGLVDAVGDLSQKPKPEQLSEVHVPDVRDSTAVSSASMLSNGASASSGQSSMVNMVSTSFGPIRSGNSVQIRQIPTVHSRVNGVNGSYGLNLSAQMGKMIGPARPSSLDFQSSPSLVTVTKIDSQSSCPPSPANCSVIKASDESSDRVTVQKGVAEQKSVSNPPDLDVGSHSPRLPGSTKADLVQPDLALQL